MNTYLFTATLPIEAENMRAAYTLLVSFLQDGVAKIPDYVDIKTLEIREYGVKMEKLGVATHAS